MATTLSKKYWSIDPGYHRLLHALKTVLAIIIALWLTRKQAMPGPLLAGIASGFSLQGIEASSRKKQFLQILVSDVIYLLTFSLGIFVSQSMWLKPISLICLGFTVVYVRRFGPLFSFAPMQAWIFCFLGSIIPIDNISQGLAHLDSFILGLLIAAVVYLFIFRQDYLKVFNENCNYFYFELATSLLHAKENIKLTLSIEQFKMKFIHRDKEKLLNYYTMNAENYQYFLGTPYEQELSNLLINQNAILKAYSIVLEAFEGMIISHQQIPEHLHPLITKIFFAMSKNFESLANKSRQAIDIKPLVEQLNQELATLVINDVNLIIAILNIKLGLRLINKNYQKLVQCNFN